MTIAASRIAPFALALAALLAALAPLLSQARSRDTVAAGAFPGWPANFEGRPLNPLPLTPREALFVRDFPGRVGRFEDGRREIIVRWVSAATRMLHPAADCFRGIGYAVSPLPARRTTGGEIMSCFRATRGTEAMTVCELIRSPAGEHWPDVSAWYWSALLATSPAPWWSYVVSERE
jgi:hypothetical protein